MVTQRPEDFLLIGHRGAAGLEPENTLAAFREAVRIGVDGVELDVRCVGGELVVFHDEQLDRTTDGHGALANASLESLRRLDAGHGERVPTLEEVLAAVPERVLVNVELKGPGTAAAAADLLAGSRRRLLVSSFDHERLRAFRARCPHTPVAPLVGAWSSGVEALARSLNAWSVNLAWRVVTAARVAEVRSWGCRCLVFTVNSVARARRLRAMGADGIFTDYPNRMRKAAATNPAAPSSFTRSLRARIVRASTAE